MVHTNSMIEGKPTGLLMRFAIPMMLGNAFQLFYTIADSAVAGRLIGVNAFAAIGSSAFYSWMVISTIMGVTQGFGVILAQRFGAEDIQGLRKAYAMSILLSLTLGVSLAVISAMLAQRVLVIINTPDEIMDYAMVYLRVLMGGSFVTFMYNLLCSALRALGNSKTPLYAMIMVSVLSVALDVLLVKVIPLGVAGVAIAAITAQFFACGFCLWNMRGIRELRLTRDDWRVDVVSIGNLLRMGIPMGFRNGVVMMSGLITQNVINGYGTVYVAGISAAKRIYGLLELLGTPVEGAVATYVAQNYGAGRLDRIGEGMRGALRIMLCGSFAIAAIALLFGNRLMGLLITGDSAQVAAILNVAGNQLLFMAVSLPTLYLLFLYRAGLQGIGSSILPMAGGIIEMIFRAVCMLVMPLLLREWGVYLSEVAGWPFTALFLYVGYRVVYRRKRDQSMV